MKMYISIPTEEKAIVDEFMKATTWEDRMILKLYPTKEQLEELDALRGEKSLIYEVDFTFKEVE